ncbi:Ucc1p KNAG_0A02530 [Huiozyma naganishii CBS 8797]|uniref:F-box domain-containing protein n=1 Tax=Huiozyma naganishii (strain ATCC MYA-139 / BCRC 22969 / CBS 8797 / KCTC 17520 / NBRC 10181 / NCYC 3082 / Yp74L-3) TaxID=1071383 RepID=J7RTA0_HUIN7|nr:hypothetical protein KNAG_0A02530 [Kazachstania naganishii CBS 8797]CCK67942.1 hypothetical protein KNAG_0A02530 [Kazachstania naganishii CBS 8797]
MDCLPDEVLLRCLEFCDGSTGVRVICKRLCLLRNEAFRHRVLHIFPLSHPLWQSARMVELLAGYVRWLDPVRRESRLLLYRGVVGAGAGAGADTRFPEYICDSWEILFNVLTKPAPLYNTVGPFMVSNELLLDSSFVVPREEEKCMPLNVWIYLEDVRYVKLMTKIVTEVYSKSTNSTEVFFFAGYLDDWIRDPGIYCIKLGNLPKTFMRTASGSHVPLKIKSYFGYEDTAPVHDGKLKLLGFNFNPYPQFKPWLFFKISLEQERYIFNWWESNIGQELAELTKQVADTPDGTQALLGGR